MARDTLILFTANFPYRNVTEAVFVRSELKALAAEFDRVVVVPRWAEGELSAVDTPGVEVDTSLARHIYTRFKPSKLPWLLTPTVIRRLPAVLAEAHGVRALTHATTSVLNTAVFAPVLRRLVERYAADGPVVLYSYWFDMIPDALVAGCGDRWPVVTRAHRYDLFDDQVPFRSCLMRGDTLRGLAAVYAVSRDGCRYMAERYPAYADKIHLATLGSVRSDSVLSSMSSAGQLTLLSVSRVTEVKRVEACLDLAVSLAQTYPWIQVRWIHVGDGPLMPALRHRAGEVHLLPSNLSVDLRGALTNDAVHRLYAEEAVDWFMLLSTSEGLPVSICEALSYGVPVLATDVGGVAEAVTADAGIVLPVTATAHNFVAEMQPYLSSPADYMALREGARRRWTECYDASVHSKHFAKLLKNHISR